MVNFFYIDRNLATAARWHGGSPSVLFATTCQLTRSTLGDKHLNKMQVESAQLASSVWHLLAPTANVADFETRIKPRIYRISHAKNPLVLWGKTSLAHYMALVELGIQLNVEKQRRIANMVHLPTQLQRSWSMVHKSQDTLQFLKTNPPPVAAFEQGEEWTDPPPAMPDYYKTDDEGEPRDIVLCYRLYYAGSKIQITNLKWLPYADEPPWLEEMKRMIEKSRKMREGLAADVAKFVEQEGKKLERRASSGAARKKKKKLQDEEEEEDDDDDEDEEVAVKDWKKSKSSASKKKKVEQIEDEEEEEEEIEAPKRKISKAKAKGSKSKKNKKDDEDSGSEWTGN
jgi:hypothetical protein